MKPQDYLVNLRVKVAELEQQLSEFRALIARLLEWADQLEHGANSGSVGPFIAAELRRRMWG